MHEDQSHFFKNQPPEDPGKGVPDKAQAAQDRYLLDKVNQLMSVSEITPELWSRTFDSMFTQVDPRQAALELLSRKHQPFIDMLKREDWSSLYRLREEDLKNGYTGATLLLKLLNNPANLDWIKKRWPNIVGPYKFAPRWEVKLQESERTHQVFDDFERVFSKILELDSENGLEWMKGILLAPRTNRKISSSLTDGLMGEFILESSEESKNWMKAHFAEIAGHLDDPEEFIHYLAMAYLANEEAEWLQKQFGVVHGTKAKLALAKAFMNEGLYEPLMTHWSEIFADEFQHDSEVRAQIAQQIDELRTQKTLFQGSPNSPQSTISFEAQETIQAIEKELESLQPKINPDNVTANDDVYTMVEYLAKHGNVEWVIRDWKDIYPHLQGVLITEITEVLLEAGKANFILAHWDEVSEARTASVIEDLLEQLMEFHQEKWIVDNWNKLKLQLGDEKSEAIFKKLPGSFWNNLRNGLTGPANDTKNSGKH